ncbi:papain fold toxin domain-containing protein [Alteromonas lipotrueiana]|uniref:papain fold toxin domain-containing protein n=1 Tax=Alteromonas lipotrueiana TaxID=2803815 RepID=UPI001C47D81F|nr:papain fold toxin domain-containing protein [Alteromonas lipotrueiana]
METQRKGDIRVASEICSELPRLKYLEAAEDMVKKFGNELQVMHIYIEEKAIAPFIVLSENRKEVITTTHNHYAVFLNDLVFDNEFPNGLPIDEWLGAFMYMSKDGIPTLLARDDIKWMRVEQFKTEMDRKNWIRREDNYGYGIL